MQRRCQRAAVVYYFLAFSFVLLKTNFKVVRAAPVLNVDEGTNILETSGQWWEIDQTPDALFNEFANSAIYLRTVDLDESKVHSCYEYKVIDKVSPDKRITHTDTFCYPAVIIGGHRKCSTSALYNLLAQYPRTIRSQVKENCAFIGDRSLVQYFDSLPRSVEAGELIVDGCIDMKGNVKMRRLLRNPNTFYLVSEECMKYQMCLYKVDVRIL